MRIFLLLLLVPLGVSSAEPWPPFLEAHCVSCHEGDSKKAGLDLTLPIDLSKPAQLSLWVRLHDRVQAGEMPPKKQPPAAEKAAFLKALAAELTTIDAAKKGTILRRLNRTEYENTLHDLFDIRIPLQDFLPEDGRAHGFDTVGEALDLSAVQLQRYMDAANAALDAASKKRPKPERKTTVHHLGDGRDASFIGDKWLKRGDAIVAFTGGYPRLMAGTFAAPADGTYRINITAYHYQATTPLTIGLFSTSLGRANDLNLLGFRDVPGGKPGTVSLDVYLRQGDALRLMPYDLTAAFAIKQTGMEKYPGPGLAVVSIEADGPFETEYPGKGYRLLFGDLPMVELSPTTPAVKTRPGYKPQYTIRSANPAADLERLIPTFAKAVYRRPVPAEKITPFITLANAELKDGTSFEESLRTAYVAILCSPEFLYRPEPVGMLDGYAIASRMSYFLTGGAPDTALLAAAANGELVTAAGRRAQTERLLQSPKSERFVNDFVDQWLNLRELTMTTPDSKLYPEFDEPLQDAMLRETRGFFTEMLTANRPVQEFIRSDWTMLNARLARHYAIPGVTGPEFRKVQLPANSHRGGLLTQASILKVSANGTSTSPVVRGAWVLDRILNTPAPPPPPNIPGVEPDIRGSVTIRQQFDKHRTLESCNGCHKVIDPPGFALEAYDPIGGFRNRYRISGGTKKMDDVLIVSTHGRDLRVPVGLPTDTSGQTVDGKKFTGPADYCDILLADRRQFPKALAEKLMTYSTGRAPGFSDRAAIDAIVTNTLTAGGGFRELVHQVVLSPMFGTK